MDKVTFLKGIKYLKGFYINFNFDINDNLQIEVWYQTFKDLSNETYINMILSYCKSGNEYPPTSPANLMSVLKKNAKRVELAPEEAWLKVVNLIRKHGLTYNRDKFYKELEKYPLIYKAVEGFERELNSLTTDDTYTPNQFKQYYSRLLEQKVDGTNQLLLNGEIKHLLEKKDE